MYIRIYKTLEAKAAARLRKAQQKLHFFSAYSNSDFLLEEFSKEADEYHIFDYIDKKEEKSFTLQEELGPYTFSKYFFSSTLYKLYFGLNWDAEHEYAKVVFNLNFAALKTDKLARTCKLELLAAWNAQTSNKKFEFFLKSDASLQGNVILNIPAYFYNERILYEKIFSSLVKNKARLVATCGSEAFVKDLLALFSVKTSNKKIPAFELQGNKRENAFIIYEKASRGIYEEEGAGKDLLTLSSFNNGHVIDSEIKGVEEITLRVGKAENLLVADFVFGHTNVDFLAGFGIVGDMNIKKVKDNKKLEEFLTLHLKAWLENYVALAEFTAEVYGKVKTKLLVNSLNT